MWAVTFVSRFGPGFRSDQPSAWLTKSEHRLRAIVATKISKFAKSMPTVLFKLIFSGSSDRRLGGDGRRRQGKRGRTDHAQNGAAQEGAQRQRGSSTPTRIAEP